MAAPPVEYLFKVLVVGDKGAGKTSLVTRYVHNTFTPNLKITVGVDFALKLIEWNGKTNVTLQLWDIAGQERYGQMCRVYYQAAVGALVMFDSTRPDTLETAAKWKEDIDQKVRNEDDSKIQCILVATKCDMPPNPRRTDEEMDEFCKQQGFAGWVMTSSKEKIAVEKPFQMVVKEILARTPEPAETAVAGGVRLANKKEDGHKCCR